jgi:hypothetical protein
MDLIKSAEWEGEPLYNMLSEDEKAFADSLLKLAEELGPLDQSEGIWIGYEDGSTNQNASIGVKCGNCALHKSAIACAIISQQIEEEGACRLAVIPDGYVSVDRTSNSFLIPSDGRGLSGSTASYHDSSDEVSMFFSCQDSNNSIIYGTCSFQDQESTGRQYNGIGLIVPDFSDFEKMTHDGLDHCGYHKPLPWEALSGKNDCGTYLGGEYNGFRGIDIYQRALDREEELMENVGEKCVLLVRKWAGETCSCITLRRQNPKLRTCKFCFGTGIVGGYEQYINRRRADNRVMVRFYETPENLAFGDHQHLNQDFKPSALALYKPIIKDRDVVIRFDYTDDIEYIYEVLDVSRERFVFNKYGRQKINLQRMDKTDILYQFPFIKT